MGKPTTVRPTHDVPTYPATVVWVAGEPNRRIRTAIRQPRRTLGRRYTTERTDWPLAGSVRVAPTVEQEESTDAFSAFASWEDER